MTVGCNIWMICLKLNWFFYDPSWMLQLSEFISTILSWAWVVFNNFLLIDATDRSKISSCQKHFFFAVSLYPFHFSRTLPLRRRLFLTNYCPINVEHCNCVVVLRKISFKPLSDQYCGRYCCFSSLIRFKAYCCESGIVILTLRFTFSPS